MSCSSPIRSYTNAKYLYPGVSRFVQQYACGKCSSCISKQRTDWRVRAYYEAKDCLSKSKESFVLFDSLTYSDEHIKTYRDLYPDLDIPRLLDKPCFSRYDVQTFFKRLRINLVRAGYDIEDKLRYILTSEFGSAESTRGFVNTHRPHYHLLFFVNFKIDPIVFSRFVSESWINGKTDGVKPGSCDICPVKSFCKGYCIYQSKDYVLRERLVSKNNPGNCMKCVNYLTKYISKDMYMTEKLQYNVDMLFRYLFPDYQTDLQQYRFYRKFCSQVMPFHLQSLGFGKSLLEDKSEVDYIIKTGKVHLPTSDKNVVRSVALPRYYDRKLYYYHEKVDGRVVWKLTDFGIKTKLAQLDDKIRAFMVDYRSFDSKLSDQRLFDLALYRCVYKGTLSDKKSLNMPYKKYYLKLISPHQFDEKPLYINRATHTDKLTIGKFLSSRYLVSPDGEIIYKGRQFHKEFIPYDGYFLCTEKLCKFWYGFDKKLASFQKWRNTIGKRST